MPQHTVVAMFLVSLVAVGCNAGNANTSQSGATPSPGTKASAGVPGRISDTLPGPKTKMSLQQKSTKAFPMANNSKFFYEVVDQWVFQPDDTDDSLICVGDGEHCITLQKLKEQLNRPAMTR